MVEPLRVPGYRVEARAGSGGSGDVWVAVEERTGRRVALKRLRGAGAAERAALRREAAVQARLAHPHVLAVHAVLEAGGGLVLVLDHAAGGSLEDVLDRRGPLSPGELVTALAPVGQALAAAHRAGVVHGDVTPANVLLTADGRPLLADLGVARVAGVRPAEVAATVGYAAPEVLAGQPPRPAADVHALACVAVRALTGAPPDTWATVPAGTPERLDLLPPAALAVLEGALSARADDRPDAEEVAAALFAAAVPEPVALGLPAAPATGASGAATAAVDLDDADAAAQRAVTARVASGAARRAADVPPGDPPAGRSRRRWPGRVAAGTVVAGALVVGVLALLALVTPAVSAAWQAARGDVPSADAAPAGTPAAAAPVPSAPPAGATAGSAPPARPAAAPSCPPPAAARSAPADVDWPRVVAALHTARTTAFAARDPARLCAAYAAGSPGLRADRATLARYVAAGLRPRGLAVDVVAARPERATRTTAVVRVTDRMAPYELLDARGDVAAREPALPARSWRAALVRTAAGWRFG